MMYHDIDAGTGCVDRRFIPFTPSDRQLDVVRNGVELIKRRDYWIGSSDKRPYFLELGNIRGIGVEIPFQLQYVIAVRRCSVKDSEIREVVPLLPADSLRGYVETYVYPNTGFEGRQEYIPGYPFKI